jgi:hypothetical protein
MEKRKGGGNQSIALLNKKSATSSKSNRYAFLGTRDWI